MNKIKPYAYEDTTWLGAALISGMIFLLLCCLVSMWSVKKVRLDTRVAEALEKISQQMAEKPNSFVYVCKSFPRKGTNLHEWLRWSGKCRLGEEVFVSPEPNTNGEIKEWSQPF